MGGACCLSRLRVENTCREGGRFFKSGQRDFVLVRRSDKREFVKNFPIGGKLV